MQLLVADCSFSHTLSHVVNGMTSLATVTSAHTRLLEHLCCLHLASSA